MGTHSHKIVAAITGDGLLDIGAMRPIAPGGADADEVARLACSSSAPVTFIETDDAFIETDDALPADATIPREARAADFDRILQRMERLIDDATPVGMHISSRDGARLILEPVEEWMRHERLKYSVDADFLAKIIGNKACPGTDITVQLRPFTIPTVAMFFKGVAQAATEDGHDLGHYDKTLAEELKVQPEGTFLQVAAGETVKSDDDNGRLIVRVYHNGRPIGTTFKEEFANPLPDGTCIMRPGLTAKGNLTVDSACGRVIGLRYSPAAPWRYVSDTDTSRSLVTGLVHKIFDMGRILIAAIFTEPDGERWRSGVFRLKSDDSEALPFPVRDAARRYIRVGYPCTFRVNFNPARPEQSKLLLTGLSSVLIGRVGPTVNTRHLVVNTPLPDRALSPAARIGDEIMMVDAGYTAFMAADNAPLGLRLMTEAGIFSSQVAVNCRLELTEVNAAEGRRFKVLCTPCSPKYGQKYPPGTQVANVRICCSAGDRLILMAGATPAMTDPIPCDTRLAILRGLTTPRWTVAECRPDGWLVLRCTDFDIDIDEIVTEGLTIGELFEMDRDETYRERPVLAVPAGRRRPAGTLMMALIVDERSGAIVATDQFSHFTDCAWTGQRRMKVNTALLDYSLLVVEGADGKLNASQIFSPAAQLILRRLKALYGERTTALMERKSGSRPVTALMTGVICQHDYSALLGKEIPADVAGLWDDLDENTPVLFGDIAITRHELPGLADRAASAAQVTEVAAGTGSDLLSWQVMKYDRREDTLCFWTGKSAAQHVGRAALRLPVAATTLQRMTQKPLTELLPLQSKWRIERDKDGNVRIHAHTDNIARPYTLVSRLNDSEWVVRSDDGSIALTRDAGDNARPGERVMMAYSGEIGPVVYVARKDEILIGMKLRLQVTEIADGVAVCRDMAGNIRRRIELPLGNVSWNEDWTPRQLASGTVLSAVVVDEEPGLLVVDRRLLLHQDALYPGVRPQPGATYQMEVVGVGSDGYRLSQNGVEILLPFDKAAVCELNIFNENYLRVGDLVAVKVDADGYTADWRLTRARAIAELETAGDSLMTFSVHHFSPDGIFVMRRGVMMFLPNNQVGHWAGRPLDGIFAPGTLLQLIVTRSESGTLEVRALNPLPFVQAPPQRGERLRGVVSHIYPSMGCYVDCGIDLPPVYVEAADFVRTGREMEPGLEVAVRVGEIYEDDGIVMGHLADPAPKQASDTGDGPRSGNSVASAESAASPDTDYPRGILEIKVFRGLAEPPEPDAATVEMLATDGSRARFELTDDMPLELLKDYFNSGRGALAIVDQLSDGTLVASHKPLIKPREQLLSQLKATPGRRLRLKGRIIGITDNHSVVLQSGMAVLTIASKKLAARGTDGELAQHYPRGAELDVTVYSVSGGYTFSATDMSEAASEPVRKPAETDLPPIDSPQ